MKTSPPSTSKPAPLFWLGAGGLAAIALVCLWREHRLHLLGAVPYLLILLCPLMHLFMHHGGHGGHGGHDGHGHAHPPSDTKEPPHA